jgi:hypothetical protein
MDHQAFSERVNEALRAKSEGRLDDAVAQFQALREDLKIAMKISVSDWHQQQTLSLLADALGAAGKDEECLRAWQEEIDFNQSQLNYWREALSSSQQNFERWKNESKNRG